MYPSFYTPKKVIDGHKENYLPIITMEFPAAIQHAIWEILPIKYEEDWADFQNYMNTLTISNADIDTDIWNSEAFLCRRSLIIVNGFYTCYLIDGGIYYFYVSLLSQKPFSLAGIYNQLEDGF